jgi:hypothetical protein
VLNVKIFAAAILAFAMSARLKKKSTATLISNALTEAGFCVDKNGGKATADTVIGWHKRFSGPQTKPEWRQRFDDYLKLLMPSSMRLIMGNKPNSKDVEAVLAALTVFVRES